MKKLVRTTGYCQLSSRWITPRLFELRQVDIQTPGKGFSSVSVGCFEQMLFVFISWPYFWYGNMKGIEQFHEDLGVIGVTKEVPGCRLLLSRGQFCNCSCNPQVTLFKGRFVLELFGGIS